MTEQAAHDAARQSRATRFMLVAVIGFSAIPVYIAVADTHRAPFVFTAFLYAGQFVGLGAYTLLTYRALFFRRGPLGVIARQVVRPTMLLTLTGYLNYAFYSWSTEYIDPAVTTVIFGGWTFTTVLFVGWTFRSERRYERTSGALVGFMLIGFAGFALAILSQRADIFDFGQGAAPLIEVGIGVLLAVISMSMATLGSFVLKWGVETAQRIDAAAEHPYEQSELEVAGVLTGIVVAALVAIPVNLVLGLARGESMLGISPGGISSGGIAGADYALAFGVGLFSLGFCTALFRRANLMTRNLGIIGMTYGTLPVSLLWLALLGEIDVERPLYLAAGAALIVVSNLLVHFVGRRSSSAEASES